MYFLFALTLGFSLFFIQIFREKINKFIQNMDSKSQTGDSEETSALQVLYFPSSATGKEQRWFFTVV